jgi:hypothetical protein
VIQQNDRAQGKITIAQGSRKYHEENFAGAPTAPTFFARRHCHLGVCFCASGMRRPDRSMASRIRKRQLHARHPPHQRRHLFGNIRNYWRHRMCSVDHATVATSGGQIDQSEVTGGFLQSTRAFRPATTPPKRSEQVLGRQGRTLDAS